MKKKRVNPVKNFNNIGRRLYQIESEIKDFQQIIFNLSERIRGLERFARKEEDTLIADLHRNAQRLKEQVNIEKELIHQLCHGGTR
ncbi:MAG: hypothetical protein HDS88_00845 [Bacteroidales bacterium]|nr:hypothetical protein [Bacteroidales bacterium]